MGREQSGARSWSGRGAEAQAHRTTRLAHASERAEDYVEAVHGLIREKGEARVTDLARVMGVSHVTVVGILRRLSRDGLVATRPYRSVQLTPAGAKLARAAGARHELVERFLLALGVPATVAARDAEGIEHHVSARTLRAMRAFATRGIKGGKTRRRAPAPADGTAARPRKGSTRGRQSPAARS